MSKIAHHIRFPNETEYREVVDKKAREELQNLSGVNEAIERLNNAQEGIEQVTVEHIRRLDGHDMDITQLVKVLQSKAPSAHRHDASDIDNLPRGDEVTKESIEAALGYTPANEEDIPAPYDDSEIKKSVGELKDDIDDQAKQLDTKLTKPSSGIAVGKYFRVAALDELGNPVLEAVDLPKAGIDKFGVISVGYANNGLQLDSSGYLKIARASVQEVYDKSSPLKPITTDIIDYALRAGLLSNSQITDADKPLICQTIGAESKKEFVLIESFKLPSSQSWTKIAQPDGTPYNFTDVLVVREYGTDCPQMGAGYGRMYFVDENNNEISTESKRRSSTTSDVNLSMVQKHGALSICKFTQTSGKNQESNWQSKGLMSVGVGYGTVRKIYTNAADNDPVNTIVTIYAVRA